MARVYVASSWRNEIQQSIVTLLRGLGHQVYDFRAPHATGPDRGRRGQGFSWSEIDPTWRSWTPEQARNALDHTVARDGFGSDMDALKCCDVCVLVLPSGRSAHLEAGWASGAGKGLVIVQFAALEAELMYLMADAIVTTACEIGPAVEQAVNDPLYERPTALEETAG